MGMQIEVKVNSTIKMVRPEVGTFKLEIRPTEKFRNLEEYDQKEWLRVLSEEKTFYCNKEGTLSFRGAGDLGQYFEIHTLSESWEYAGGECNDIERYCQSTAIRSK